MYNYDKKQAIKNIGYLAKEKNIKIGDLEKKIGVAPGYFSRYLKDENPANPSLESIVNAARELNVTVDMILYCDYDSLTETDKYLMAKMNDIRIKTSNNSLLWNEITVRGFYDPCLEWDKNNREYISNYPFAKPKIENEGCEYEVAHRYYYSTFMQEELDIKGSIFYFNVWDTYFYISKVSDISKDIRYEFYYEKTNEYGETIEQAGICTVPKESVLFNQFEDLYSLCVVKSKEPRLNSGAKSALDNLDRYLNPEKYKDELPF